MHSFVTSKNVVASFNLGHPVYVNKWESTAFFTPTSRSIYTG